MNKLLRFLTLSFIIFSALTFVLWRKWERQQRKESLVVGIFCSGYPYAYVNIQGDLDGFDIDLSREIASRVGKRLVFKDMPIEFLHSALKLNHVDCIGSSLIMTAKKMQRMDMIDIYGQPKAAMTFAFWKDIPVDIHTIDDLRRYSDKKPIAALTESVWVDILEENGIKNITSLEQYQSLVLPIKYGKALAIALGPRHALVLQKQFPEVKILKVKLEKPWAEGVGIALKKGNSDLKEKLEKIVAELKQDGTVKKLITKWFGEAANDC